jgi:hypothetical protein
MGSNMGSRWARLRKSLETDPEVGKLIVFDPSDANDVMRASAEMQPFGWTIAAYVTPHEHHQLNLEVHSDCDECMSAIRLAAPPSKGEPT